MVEAPGARVAERSAVGRGSVTADADAIRHAAANATQTLIAGTTRLTQAIQRGERLGIPNQLLAQLREARRIIESATSSMTLVLEDQPAGDEISSVGGVAVP